MGVEEIIKRTTIKFERPLSLEETKELFTYMVKGLHCDIYYSVKSEEKITTPGGIFSVKDVTGVSIPTGYIRDANCSYANFECQTSSKNPLFIEAIKFIPIPGYEIHEHRLEVVKIWREVKKSVSAYFKEKKQTER